MLAHRCVVLPNFDSESALTRRRTHDFRWKNLPHQVRLAEPLDAGDGQDDGVVLSPFELAQAGVDVAAQRVDFEIGTNGFQLRLPPEARSADASRVRQVSNFHEMLRARSEERRVGKECRSRWSP